MEKAIAVKAPSQDEIAVHRTRVEQMALIVRDYQATDEVSVRMGESLLKDIKLVKDAVTERKTEITRPLMVALASARDLFKPLEAGLAEAEKQVKAHIGAFALAQEEAAQKEAARVAGLVEKGRMKPETALKKMEAITSVKTNTRALVKVRVVDPDAIPREWLVPDMQLITEAILRQGITIPGVETYKEKSVFIK